MIKQLSDDYRFTCLSWGTMRAQDLIPAFEDFLREVDHERFESLDRPEWLDDWLNSETDDYLQPTFLPEGMTTGQVQDELAWYLNETLWDALNDIAPNDCYFGAHPGDGADYGFYPPDDSELWE